MAAAINQKWKSPRISASDLAETWVRDQGRCDYCDILLDPMIASFDHVVPFTKGGTNTLDNIVLCCITCQRSKYTKTPDEYEAWQKLKVTCPCGVVFRPRWADWIRGYGRFHSRACAGRSAHHG